MKICHGLSTRYNFVNYSYRDLFVSEAQERCIMAIKTFNLEKSDKAFTYLTYVAFHAMQKVINDEKKYNYTKHKYFQSQYTMSEDMANQELNEVSDRIIDEFETKAAAKTTKPLTKATKVVTIKVPKKESKK